MKGNSALLGWAVRIWGVCLGVLPLAWVQAQTPGVSPDPAAGDALLGEQYCFDVPWTNAGAPGYGPYLRLVLPPELEFDSAQLFGAALTVAADAVFPGVAPATGTLTDPLFLPAVAPGNQVTATAGWRLVILELPLGSVVENGPELASSICVTSRNAPPALAQIGTAYPIQITPVYRYGDTATGSGGSIAGATQSPTVTPQVLLFEKTDTAPEHERPPGSVWPYDYVLRVDIAGGALLEPLLIADTLPPDVQYVGPIQIAGAAAAGAGCTVVAEPALPGPGGNVAVRCEGGTLLGTGADDDIVVSFPVHITDILDEGTCGTQSLENFATADATYLPPGAPALVLPQVSDTSEVVARHVAVQKSASQQYGMPGTSIAYALELQTTQFGAADALAVLDTLPDGVDFDALAGAPSISFDGGPATPIPPAYYAYTPGINDALEFDVRGLYGADIPTGTAIRITYAATVRQNYKAAPFAPVLAADPLTNTVQASYGLSAGAAGCTDGSAATVTVDPVDIRKELITPGPFVPGDEVTFRLTMEIPSGDTQDVVFTDYFPLPVFDATTISTVYGVDVELSPDDTFGQIPDSIVATAATNALTITFPDVSSPTPQVVSVDIRVRVQPDAFADNLFLTNVFRAQSNNSANEAAVGETPVQIHVRAPALALAKGVLSTDGTGTIAPPPATLPVDGNLTGADAGDAVVYRLTIENRGGAPAFDVVVTDTVPAGLTGCAVSSFQLANGTALTGTGNLFAGGLTLIRGGNAANAVLDASDGSLGAPFGSDTAFIDVTCTVAADVLPGQSFVNTASATWKPQPAGTPGVQTFPPVSDDASAGIRVPGLAKSIVATSEADSTTPNVLVGEIVRYRLAVNLPEGLIPDMRVFDVLPAGLQFLDDGSARIAFVSNGGGISSSTLGGVPTASGNTAAAAATPLAYALPAAAIQAGSGTLNCAAPGTFASGTDICFRLGDVVNADSDADAEFVVIEFNALVRNEGNAGANRDNLFRVGSGTTQLGGNSGSVRVTLRLPSVSVGKSVTPDSGVDAGDTVTYTLTIGNAGGANVMPAYDVAIDDVLPPQLSLVLPIVGAVSSGGASAFVDTSAGNTISGSIARIPAGGSVVITYQATVLVGTHSGSSIVNGVTGGWSSLPGSHGTVPNGTGSSTPGAPGASDGEREFTGAANAPIGVAPVTLGKAVVATSLGYTGEDAVRGGIADLAIGETATFHITATIPEGTAPQVVITDTVPYANGRMEVLGGSLVSIGAGLTATNDPPLISAPVDAQLGDGIADTIGFDFGQVVNPVGNGPATIVVEVLARLVDHADNANGGQLVNGATVQFGTGLSGTASAGVDVVEPLLDIQKSSPTTTGQAGDGVNFSVTVQHLAGSNMEARAVRIVDALPSPNGLTLDVPSVTPTLTGAGCLVPPLPVLTDASAGNTVDVSVDRLPLDCVLTIAYGATLQPDVVVNTDILNTAGLAWQSIGPGDPGTGRDYGDSDGHAIRVSSPGMSKWVESVSPAIGDAQVDPALADVPVGGTVTWRFDVAFPAGDSLAAIVADQLPVNTVSMRAVSSRIVSVGPGIAGINASPTPVAGTPGTASDGADPDAYGDLVTWNLGDLRAAAVPEASRTIRFEVVAQVMDTAQTAGGVSVLNTASFAASTVPTPISASSEVDVVAPLLTLEKSITNLDPAHIVQAGDTVSFRIVIAHAPGSTATAFNLVVTDLLPDPGVSFVPASVAGTCGAAADDTAAPSIVFAFDDLTLAQANCTITYDGIVTTSANPGATYTNHAVAEYDSLQTPDAEGGNRHGTTDPDSDQFTILAPTLAKVVASTSLGDTAAGQHTAVEDLAIGESVTYTLTIGFPQGTTLDAVLVDALPPGLEVIGASVGSFGNPGIATSLPGTPVPGDSGVGYDDTVTFDFGTITNPPNASQTDDWISVTVVARVRDAAANVDGLLLTNTATFSNGTSPDVPATADVELVEPALELTKTMTAGDGGSATITLTVENTGTGPAYDLVLEDVLSHAVWNAASIAIGTVPAGYTGALDTATPGQTTAAFTGNAGVALLPGASVTATLTATLALFPPDPNPVQNSAEIATHGSVPFDPANPDIRDYDPVGDTATLGFPDPVVTKVVANGGSGEGGTFLPGDVVVFSVVVQNAGAGPLADATLDEQVPVNTTFVAASSDAGWTCDDVTAGSACTLGAFTVAAGATSGFAFAVRIDDPLPVGVTQVVNQAFLSSPDLPPGVDIPSDDPDQPGDEDPTPAPLAQLPEIAIVKTGDYVDTNGDGVANVGDHIHYGYTVTNTGNVALTGVAVTELAAGFTGTGVLPVPAIDPAAWPGAVGVLQPGESVAATAIYAITQADIDAGGVTNQAQASGDDPDGDPVTDLSDSDDPLQPGDDDPTDTPLGQAPSIEVNKTSELDPDLNGNGLADEGDAIAYTVTATNTGNVTLHDVTVVDSFNGEPETTLSCAPATLPPGATASCAGYSHVVTAEEAAGGAALANVATASGTPPATPTNPTPDPVVDEDGTSDGVCGLATGTVTGLLWHDANRNGTREPDGTDGVPGTADDEIPLQTLVTLGPVGGSEADIRIGTPGTDGVYLFANVPAGTYEVVTLDVYLANNFGLFPLGTSTRTVEVLPCLTAGEDFAYAAPEGGVVGDYVWFDLDSSGAPTEFYDADGNGVLTDNTGTDISVEDFEWIDINGNGVPDGGEFDSCGLKGVTVDLLDEDGETVVASAVTDIRGGYLIAGLELGRSYTTRVDPDNAANFARAQEISASGRCLPYVPPTPVAGETARGTVPAPRGAPAGCGATTPLSVASAVLTADEPADFGNDYGLVCNVEGTGDLALAKALTGNADEDGSGTISLGDTLTYTITATNTGIVTLSNVVVSDSRIAPSTVTCAELPVGESCVLTGTYVVTQADVDSGRIENTATATSNEAPEVPPAVVETPVPQSPELDVVKTATLQDTNGNGLGDEGETIDYAVTVTNTGNVTLTGLVVTDSFNGEPETTLDCAPTTLPPQGVATCTGYSRTISAEDLLDGAPLSNVATATAVPPATQADPTPDPVGDDDEETVPNAGVEAALAIEKTGPGTAMPGEEVQFTIVVENLGPNTALDVLLADPTPAGLIFVSNAGDCVTAFPCHLGDLAVGETRTVLATFQVQAHYLGTRIVNTATASSASTPTSVTSTAVLLLPQGFRQVPADARWALALLIGALALAGAVGAGRRMR